MGKKLMNWMLMAAMVLSLGMSVTSCKDDDDDNNNGTNSEVGGTSSIDMALTDDELVLAALVQQWCDVEPGDLKSGIINQTFEPSIGYAEGNVRTMVMETQEAADAYAVSALSKLNIDPQQPAGFSWTGSLGSVSYSRGTGNELGVINVSIRQIPHLQKIRLVKDAEDNAPNGGVAYYQKGDIVKYTGSGKMKGCYFICLNDHKADQPSNWITFYTGRKTGTCGWGLTGKDSVYNEELASTSSLATWLREFVLDDEQWTEVVAHARGVNSEILDHIVPGSAPERCALVRKLIRTPEQVVLDAWQPYSDEDNTVQAVKAGWAKRVTKEKSKYVVETFTPTGMLLCNTMRWSMGMTYDYWVPNLVLVKRGSKSSDALWDRVSRTPSQTTLSESHFKAQSILDFNVDISGLTAEENGRYDLFQTAVHWTHDVYKVDGDPKEHYGLLNFTTRDPNEQNGYMTEYNITSYELTVTDKGEKYKYFEDVFRRQAQSAKILKERYALGDVLQDDEDGSRWFCIRPSANQLTQFKHAMFISFDDIKTYDNADRSASNIVSKADVHEAAFYLSQFILTLDVGDTNGEGKSALNGIKNYAGADTKKIFAYRDSDVVAPHHNHTHNLFFGVAYNDGTRDRQPVIRAVVDGTHCLITDRTKYKGDAYYYNRLYNNYQLWDGKKQWEGDWTMSSQPMYLDDVANQQMVNTYATDKWVVLPFWSDDYTLPRQSKRTAVDVNGGKVSRYLLKNGQFVDATARNMYNEPVLFFRTMWMEDFKQANADGHKMTVLYHTPPKVAVSFDLGWYSYFISLASQYLTVDNELKIPFQLTK